MRIVLLVACMGLPIIGLAQADQKSEAAQAWSDFTSQLETAGLEVLENYPQPEPLDTAEGLRYLLQQLGSSLQQELIDQPGQVSLPGRR